jgi:hypothetical protein
MNNKFGTLCVLGVIWVVMFAVTIVTEARFMARGVMPMISAICVLWLAYWSVSLLRSAIKSTPESKVDGESKTETVNK